MISEQSEKRLRAEIVDQAASWFVELAESESEPDSRTREAFMRWLQMSPKHAFAYLQVAAFWEDAALLDAGGKQRRDELIALAKAETNVVPIGEGTREQLEAGAAMRETANSGRRRVLALAASLVVVLAGGLFAWQQFFRAPTYATGIGEQRSIRLADGSLLELNARSKVRIRYLNSERGVELVEGQMLARVAKDAARPFVVRSGDAVVRAVGTVFDVYRRKTGTTVTVVEGSVAVVSPIFETELRPDGNAAVELPVLAPLIVNAGEQLKVALTVPAEPVKTDVAAATAWTRRQIVFQRATLTEVVEEFNRYNPRRMVILDAELADTRISGVFASTDPTSLLLFVRGLPDVGVEETEREIRIARK